MNEDFWIMSPFNTLFNVVFLVFLSILVVASLLLRQKSERVKQITLVIACIMTLIGFAVYKYYLSMDSDFNIITADMGGFN